LPGLQRGLPDPRAPAAAICQLEQALFNCKVVFASHACSSTCASDFSRAVVTASRQTSGLSRAQTGTLFVSEGQTGTLFVSETPFLARAGNGQKRAVFLAKRSQRLQPSKDGVDVVNWYEATILRHGVIWGRIQWPCQKSNCKPCVPCKQLGRLWRRRAPGSCA
jgi:hypothetical protein